MDDNDNNNNNHTWNFDSNYSVSQGYAHYTHIQCLDSLHRHFLTHYTINRQRALNTLIVKFHKQLVDDQLALKNETRDYLQIEFDKTKLELLREFESKSNEFIKKRRDELDIQIQTAKKKQWCWVCEAESSYYCCWNTTYCSVECQRYDWRRHRMYCRRKTESEKNCETDPEGTKDDTTPT